MLLISCVSEWLSVAFVVNLVLFLRPILFIFYLEKKLFEEHIGASIKVDSPSGTKYLSLMSAHTHTRFGCFQKKKKLLKTNQDDKQWENETITNIYSSAKLINVRLKWIKESTLSKPKGNLLKWTYVEKNTHTHITCLIY